MAITPPLRPQEDGSAEADRSYILRQAAPVRTAAFTAIVACAFLLVVTLVGLGQLDRSEPGFLSDALGPEESGAPLERTPAPGVGVRIHSEGYTVTRWGDSVSVVGEDLGGAEWRRHVHGVTRTTAFGAEAIIVDGSRTEEFLTVTRRQGERTWRWQLATRLVPRLGRDGSVSFLDPARRRVTALVVDPVQILDEDGRDVTPEGLRWGLEEKISSWWLTLELDDRDLPLPYVIDPAVSHRASQTATTTGATSLVINVPAGMQANDLLITHIARTGNGAINTPSGWTAAGGTNNGVFLRQATFYRVATASEPASYTWTWSGTEAAAGGMSTYYGAKASSALDLVGTAGTANNTTTVTAPGITTTANDALVLAFFASNTNSTFTTASGMTERHDVGTTGATSLATDDMTQVTAGATGNKTATASASGRVVGHQVAFNVDDVAPTATQSDPGSPLAGTISLAGSASDVDSAVASVQFQHSPAGAGTWTNVGVADTTSPYSASFDTMTVADGLYDLRAVATDVAGNTGASAAVTNRRIDNTAPSSSTTFPADSTTYSATGWNAGCGTSGLCGTYSDGAGSGVQTVQVSIRQGAGNYWDGSAFASASEVWNAATLAAGDWSYALDAADFPADGSYTVRVRATDAAGNTQAPTSRTFTIDTTAPQTTIDSNPADPTSSTGASFDFSASEGGSTFQCRLDGGSWGACTSPQSYAGLTDGSHTFDVRATDAVGNQDGSPATYTWLVDSAAPTSTTSFPAAAGAYNAVSWDAGCPASGLCGTYSDGTGSGVQTVEVSIRQGAGNYWNGSAFASASELWNAATLAAGDWSYAFPASSFPADGAYTIRVRAVDDAANTELAASRTFTADTTAPQTTIDSTPPDPAGTDAAAFDFSADEPGSTFECRLDGGSWSACASPKSYTSLSDAGHTFDVRATDPAGNTDPTAATFTWLVDTTAPGSTTSFPAAAGGYNAAGWDAGCPASGLCGTYSDGAGSGVQTVEVSIRRGSGNYWDGSAFGSASEVWNAATLAAGDWSYALDAADFPADGSYTVRVRATDDVGNAETPSSRSFDFDATDPAALFSFPAAGGEYSTAAWNAGCATAGFCGTHSDATSGVAQVEISVKRVSSDLYWDGDSFDAAGETFFAAALAGGDWSYAFPAAGFPADGQYTVHVRATDDVGNTESGPSRTFRIDDTDPSAVYTFPASGGTYNTAGWDAGCAAAGLCGTASDGGSGVAQVEISLKRVGADLYWDGDSFDAAGETFFAAALAGGSWSWSFDGADFPADGTYTAHVRASDGAGNTETGPVRTFAIDTAAPQTTINSSPADPTTSSSADFDFSASEGGSTFECRLDGGAWGACTSPESYAGLADGSHTFDVRATDVAGNVDGSPASFTWTVDTADPSSTIDFPAASGEYNAAAWDAGCGTSGFCGTYADGAAGSGVQSVRVSIRRVSTGLYWDGASFSASGETLFNAALAAGDWSRAFPASSFPADGSYTVRVFATDAASNAESPSSRTFAFDGTAPTGSLTAPADGAAVRGAAVTISSDSADSGTGVASAEFQRRPAGGGAWTPIDTDSSAPYSVAWDTTALADGDYDLHALTTDEAGNTFTSPTRTVTVDNTAPSVSIVAPTGYVNGGSADPFTVTATSPDGDVLDVEIFRCSDTSAACGGGTWVSLGVDPTAPYSASWTIDADGNRALRALVRDAAGNTGVDVVEVTIDRTNPTGALTAPADGAFVTATVAVTSDSADGGSGVDSAGFERRPAGGGAWTPIDSDATAPYSVGWDTTALADGDYDLRAVTTDEAGNTFTSAARTVTVDNSAPSAPVVTLSESSPFAHVAGTEIFVNAAQTGTYDVDATSSDAQSGIDKVRFPGPTDDSSSPYGVSYDLDDLAGAQSVTSFNGVGLTASSPFTVTPDTAGPAGGSVSYADGYDADGDVTVTVDAGTDALSGVAPASTVLERRTAALAGGSCDPFAGAWSPVTSPDTVASGLCAQYRYRASDRVGNETVYTSGDVVKVDLAAPSAPALTLTESSPFAHVVGTEIFLNTAETGSYDVEATASDPVAGIEKIAFPGGIDDTSAPYAQSYDFDDLSGTQTVTAHDRAGNTASSDFQVTEDVSAPSTTDDTASIGSGWQSAPVTVTLTPTDARSGVVATYYTTDGSAPTTASTEGTSIDLTADGVYTIRYFSVDNVGNVEPVRTAFSNIRIDRTNPAAPSITLSESSAFAHVSGDEIFVNTGQAGTYDVEATSSDAGSGLEKLSFPGGVDDTTSPYSASYAFGDLAGGQTVTAHDLAGNTASDTFTVTPDTAAPAGGFVSYPDGYDADGVVTVTFDAGADSLAGLDGASALLERQMTPLVGAACDPFSGPWSTVTSPDTVASGLCARYRYRVSDRVGNEAIYTLPANVVKVDLTAPQTTIDAAPGDPSADASPSMEFSSSEGGSTFQCRLDGGSWAACTSPESLAGLADGSHTFEVRATDAAGNTDPTPASHTWTVDTDTPETTLDTVPTDPSAEDTPSFAFSADQAGSTFECRVDGGAWATCTSPEPAGPLADGSHTFAVRATDPAGNTDGTPAQHAWTVDTTAPQTTLDASPSDPSNDPTPAFAFSADEPGSTFQCRVDGAAWAPCTSPLSIGPLADGPHDFDVRATDPAGNTDGTPAQHAWNVNAGAPTVSLVQPSGYVNAADADPYTVRAASPDGDVASVELFRCSDASTACATGSWVSLGTDATAPYEASWPLDADGTRALRAVATDTGSNTGEDVVTVTIDRSVPATTIESAPSDPSASDTAAFAFSASEGGATFECRLDAGSWTPCASPESYAGLADGGHTFSVRATDTAGNVDATPASFAWTVDTAAPETTIDTAPSDPSSSSTPTFEFSSNEAGSTFECRLDRGVWTACTSPESLAGLADGSHTFEVRATDAAGTTDPTPASHTWTVDATPPGGGLADPGQYLRATVALTASPTDAGAGVQSVDFQLSPADAGTWTSIDVDTSDPYGVAWDTTGEADGLYDLRVVVTDNAGNVTPSAVVEDRVVDNTAPGATMNDPGAYLRATVSLTSSTSDTGSGVASVAYQRSAAGAGSWTPAAASWDTASVADGLYDLRVVVTDNAGNSATSASVDDRRVDNTKPSLSSTGPADGSTIAAAGTLAIVAGEDVAGIANAELDGAPAPAPTVSGDTVTYTSAFASGPHTLSGELEDLAGNRQAIRVHFTVWSGASLDYPFIEKNSFAAAATSLRSTSDTATLTVPSGAWSGAPAGDWLVVRLDPQPAGGVSGGFQSASEAIDVTAYWALSGGSVTSFSVPLELEIDNTLGQVIPATWESGAWRAIAAVPGSGLPASWSDGFERDGTNVRILTRHLTQFTLLRDAQAPSVPGGFKGTLSGKTFTLSWSASSDNSGLVSAYRVYANGAVVKTVGGSARSAAMGTFKPTDARSFQVTSVDEAGNVSTKSYALRAVPKLTKLTLTAAKKALTKRGFKVGKVTYKRSTSVPKGRVIAAGATGLRRVGTKITISISKGGASSPRPVTGTPVAAPPSAPPPATSVAPPPAAPPAAEAPAAEGETATPSGGGLFGLPFDRVRSRSLSELRQELGFGLLVAAFSVAFASVLRARRPLGAGAGDTDQELLWDVRLLRSVGRLLRRLTGRG